MISFLPGTYGTSLMRNHAMRGAFAQMRDLGFPDAVVEAVRDSVDCNLYFMGKSVSMGGMYAVLLITIAVLIALYIGLNLISAKKHR